MQLLAFRPRPSWVAIPVRWPDMEDKKKAKMQAKVGKVMREWKAGTLHSGKGGPVVKSKEQAIAIGMSEARKAVAKK